MITNQFFGITYIILGALIILLKGRFYIFKEHRLDKYGRWYMGFLAIAIGIWRIFFIEKPDQFVKTVNENFNLWFFGV
jgi:hypothetical protein